MHHLRYYWNEVMGAKTLGIREKLDLLVAFYFLIWRARYHPNKEVSVCVWGIRMVADRPQTLQQSLLEIFVHGIYRFDSQLEAPVILDAGANLGVSSLYLAHRYPKAQNLALEPNPKALLYLKKNIAANQPNNIQVLPAALGRYSGVGSLMTTDRTLLNARIVAEPGIPEVTILSLPKLMADYLFDLIKMDIEGSEWEVLQTWKQMPRLPAEIIMELHPPGTDGDPTPIHQLFSPYKTQYKPFPLGNLFWAKLNTR